MPKITPIALAIREALDILGQDASTSDVRDKVAELHPDLATDLTGPRFSTRVTQNRGKKYDPGAPTAETAPPAPKFTLLDKYDLADQFFCMCGANHKHAQEILAFLNKASVQDLRAALVAWEKLVQAAGGTEKARTILESMRQGGLG
jgi:hypothetical protein